MPMVVLADVQKDVPAHVAKGVPTDALMDVQGTVVVFVVIYVDHHVL